MDLARNRFRFRFFLPIVIFILVIVIARNQLAGLFFQMRGSLMLKDLIYSDESQQSPNFACLSQGFTSPGQKTRLSLASNSLSRALDYNLSSAQTYLLLGRAYCMLGEYENAIDAYKKYTSIKPGNPLGHLELGFAYEALGKRASPDFVDLIEKIESIQPEQITGYWQLSRNEAAVDEWLAAGISSDDYFREGIRLFREERYNEALAWLQRALWIRIDSAPTWTAIAQIFEETGYPPKAVKAYWAAYFFNPESGATNLVNALDNQSNAALILSILKKVLRDYPESDQRYEWWQILSNTLLGEERWADVEQINRQALIEYPKGVEFRIDLGWSLYNQNYGWQAAAQEFEQAIAADETQPEGYFAMARLLTQEKRFIEADPYYVLAIDRKPNENWYLISRATNARSNGNLNLSLEILKRIIEKSPKYDRAYYEIAWTYHLNMQNTEAEQAIIQAISMTNEPDEWYYIRAGLIFEASGKNTEALQFFNKALKLNPKNSAAQQGASRLGD